MSLSAVSRPEVPDSQAPGVTGTGREVNLAITGMTCASCVARVERKLAKLPGVTATVNLPLETAHVVLTEPHDDGALIAAVESAGYGAAVIAKPGTVGRAADATLVAGDETGDGGESGQSGSAVRSPGQPGYAGDIDLHGRDLMRRLVVAAVLSVPVLAISMVMPWHFPGWYWVVGALALPVATWCGWPFHQAAFRAARHGASTMDTLVSIGVIAAVAWSIVEAARGRGHGVYFEVAAVVVAFLLAGRFAEHRSRLRASDALHSLLEL